MELHCYENQLTKLPTLPNRLRYLYCDKNGYIANGQFTFFSVKDLENFITQSNDESNAIFQKFLEAVEKRNYTIIQYYNL